MCFWFILVKNNDLLNRNLCKCSSKLSVFFVNLHDYIYLKRNFMQKRYIFTHFLPCLLWICLIFIFSHQPKYESEKYSQLVIWFLKLLHIDLNEWTMGGGTFLVRKLAHITEYFILFLLSFRFVKVFFPAKKIDFLLIFCIFFCIFYASTDEFHQTFIFGRVGCVADVGVDSIGILIAAAVKKYSFKNPLSK